MAGFTFDGEIESLTSHQKEFVSEVLQKRGLNAKRVLIETLGKAGDNFAANVKKITVELENGEAFKMVAKIASTNAIYRARMGTVIMFGNECILYKEVLPKFVDLQHAVGLSSEEIFRFPECYGALMEPFNEIILLEDLNELNFVMFDRFTPLTNECVKLILKNFAILHSLSFVLKNQDAETFNTYADKFGDIYTAKVDNPDSKHFFRKIETDIISLMDSGRYSKAICGIMSEFFEISAKIFKHERNLRYAVITHGDAWTNNIMFHIEENVPVQAILIDYQLSKVASPVNDLLYMIFNCTDYSTRHKHYYEWMDYYHSELDNSLANFGLSANNEYPRDQLDSDLRSHSKIYLAMVIMSQSFFVRKLEDAAAMRKKLQNLHAGNVKNLSEYSQVSQLDLESIARFKKKIEDLVDSYCEFGYLD